MVEGCFQMSAQTIQFFFTMRAQIKLYHWQTGMFSRHMGTDNVLSKLDELIDMFVEVYMGKRGRPSLTRTTNTVTIRNMSEKAAVKFVKDCIQYLQTTVPKSLKPQDTDLTNIRDEMMGELHKLLYLFTLR
jgi:hypothetical protein